MLKNILIIFGFILILIADSGSVFAYKKTLGLTDKEIIERLSKLEEGQKAIKKQLEISLHQIDKRFEQIDKRFEQIDKRFEQIDKRFQKIYEKFLQIEKRFDEIDKKFVLIDKRFEQMEKRFDEIDKRFEQINKRIDDLINFMNLLGIIFSGLVVGIFGFALWDRRTIVKVSTNEAIKEIEKEGSLVSLIKALRQLAKDDEKLANVLKQFNLL